MRIEVRTPLGGDKGYFDYFGRFGVLKDYWDESLLHEVAATAPYAFAEWDPVANEHERETMACGPGSWLRNSPCWELCALLEDDEFLDLLRDLTEIKDLEPGRNTDAYRFVGEDGYQHLHLDSNCDSNGWRRVNVEIFLSNTWWEGCGGELILCDNPDPFPDEKTNVPGLVQLERIKPLFNRTAIYETTSTRFHGHPEPYKGKRRTSFVKSYYTQQPPQDRMSPHPIIWWNT